jgi:hypothetical protein
MRSFLKISALSLLLACATAESALAADSFYLVYGIVKDTLTSEPLDQVLFGLQYNQPGSERVDTTGSQGMPGLYYAVMYPPENAPPDDLPGAIKPRFIASQKKLFEIRNGPWFSIWKGLSACKSSPLRSRGDRWPLGPSYGAPEPMRYPLL